MTIKDPKLKKFQMDIQLAKRRNDYQSVERLTAERAAYKGDQEPLQPKLEPKLQPKLEPTLARPIERSLIKRRIENINGDITTERETKRVMYQKNSNEKTEQTRIISRTVCQNGTVILKEETKIIY